MRLPMLAAGTAAFLALAACGRQDAGAPPQADAEPETGAAGATLERTPSPAGARVFFIMPADGDVVANPVRVEFGIEGMQVVKAGVEEPDTGHHHLLIDTGLPDLGLPIPADGRHIHFGDGSTSTEITLPPGQHTLTMLLGDHRHVPHEPPVASAPVTITVQ